MPCNFEYLNPTTKEKQLQRVAQMYSWLLEQLKESIPCCVQDTSRNIYAQDDYTAELCAKMTCLQQEYPGTYSAVVLAPNKEARELATWWEEHQEADRIRLEKEIEEQKQDIRYEELMSKFTPEEINFIEWYAKRHS